MANGRKTGGRVAGVPNKATVDVRAAIAMFAKAHVEQMGEWLMGVEDPAKRLDLYLRAIEYYIPKLGRQEIELDVGGNLASILSKLGKS
jgi:hypothetical protein